MIVSEYISFIGGGGGGGEKFNQGSEEVRPTRFRVKPARVSSPQVDLTPLWPGPDPYSLDSALSGRNSYAV